MTWKYRRDCFNAREGVGFISRKTGCAITTLGGLRNFGNCEFQQRTLKICVILKAAILLLRFQSRLILSQKLDDVKSKAKAPLAQSTEQVTLNHGVAEGVSRALPNKLPI
jgi:hypothetical protein